MAEEIKKAAVFPNDPYGRLNGQGTYFKTSPAGNVYMTDVDGNNVPTGFRSKYYRNDPRVIKASYGGAASQLGNGWDTGGGGSGVGGSWLSDVLGGLEGVYKNNVSGIEAGRDAALRDAYVSYKQSGRNLPQQYAAEGVTGGQTYTDMARGNAAYQGGRNDIYTGALKNLTDLAAAYQSDVANQTAEYKKIKDDQNFQLYLEKYKKELENGGLTIGTKFSGK